MHKLFDKALASRINEVFENHQEVYRPEDWAKLRSQLKENQKGIVIWFPFIAKAASVAILIGLSVFTLNDLKENRNEFLGSKTIKEYNITYTDSINKKNLFVKESEMQTPKTDKVIVKKTLKENSFNDLINNRLNSNNEDILVDNQDSVEQFDNNDLRFANIKKELQKQSEEIRKMEKLKPDSNRINLQNDLPEMDFVEKNKTHNRFDVGVEVASVSNYAVEGDGSSINVGGGFSTAWNFSKNFSLTTGMILARQSINYNQNQSSGRVMSEMNGMYADANSLKMVDMNSTDSKLEFVGIDIPLNVQFSHKRMTLTTGISSLIYIQEKFSYSYSSVVTNTSYNVSSKSYETQNTISQVNEQEKSEMFSRFDFARLVNLAVGYKIPLNKGDIMFEPYLKLPIGNISSYDIKMGSGGLALRYYF